MYLSVRRLSTGSTELKTHTHFQSVGPILSVLTPLSALVFFILPCLSFSLSLSLLLVSLNPSISLYALVFARMNRVSKDDRLSWFAYSTKPLSDPINHPSAQHASEGLADEWHCSCVCVCEGTCMLLQMCECVRLCIRVLPAWCFQYFELSVGSPSRFLFVFEGGSWVWAVGSSLWSLFLSLVV